MFTIKPVQNEEAARGAVTACGGEYTGGTFVYEMRDSESGALMGVTQFDIGETGIILTVLPENKYRDDREAMFILLRSTMNFIDVSGAHICRAPYSAGDGALLRSAGFSDVGDSYICDMSGMFTGHCGGKGADGRQAHS